MAFVKRGPPWVPHFSCLTPIQDAHWHPHSCFCHTQLVNQRVRNEYSAIIRIFLHIRALCTYAKKNGYITGSSKRHLSAPWAPETRSCGRKRVPFLFAMSNMAYAFWGPFQAPSLVSSERPQEADTSICCVYTQKERIANTYTKVSPQSQSIKSRRYMNCCFLAQSKEGKKEKYNALFSAVFQHVCPDFLQVTSPNGVKLRPWGQELSSGHKHPCFRTRTFFVFHCSFSALLPQAGWKRSHLTASYVAIFSGYSWTYH